MNTNQKANKKEKLNLNSKLSLRALEAKARRAAAVAAVKYSDKDKPKPIKQIKKKPTPLIDRQINSIHKALQANSSLADAVVLKRNADSFGCLATISIYRNAPKDLSAASPDEMYAFYSGTVNPCKLGSIAIYGANPFGIQRRITGSGCLFGHRIINARIEIGRRPFVDVTIAS